MGRRGAGKSQRGRACLSSHPRHRQAFPTPPSGSSTELCAPRKATRLPGNLGDIRMQSNPVRCPWPNFPGTKLGLPGSDPHCPILARPGLQYCQQGQDKGNSGSTKQGSPDTQNPGALEVHRARRP